MEPQAHNHSTATHAEITGQGVNAAVPVAITSAALFTAAQIAVAAGKSKRGILSVLGKVAAQGAVIVRGNAAQTWSFCSLPVWLQECLQSRAVGRGYKNPEQLLSEPRKLYQPPIPLNQVGQYHLDKAYKLQRALAPALGRMDDTALSEMEFEQLGIEDYRREFRSITARHWRRLWRRTLERDGGAEEFDRLELYLDARITGKDQREPRAKAYMANGELQKVVGTFHRPAAPSREEKAYLWVRTFELYEAQLEGEENGKRVKRDVLETLLKSAPFLSDSLAALRKQFERKYQQWTTHDRNAQVLRDGRTERSGFHRGPELATADRDALIGHATLNCDGRVAQAWRELAGKGALSEDLLGYYLSNPASKSYVPARVREAVKYEVAMLDDIHHGPRQAKLNGAHITRDWSGVAAMDWLCGDDATLEVYFYVPDGKGWFTLMRGQFLPMIDVRSLCVLGFGLRPEKSYNAAMIRTLITRVCDEHGLPRKGFYFERGIWANSRLLKGDASADPLSWPETELGLRSLGLRFVHSKLPRSKPIERVIGALQDLMEGEPGYVGPDEMHEKFERVKQAKLQVEARKTHPAEHFYSLDEWEARLDTVCAGYNTTAQGGKMTEGLCPDDAFVKFWGTEDPPTKLPASCRYLLAHHKRPLKVTSNGITLRFGNQAFNYRNEETGRLRGQMVLAWFNPDLTETLTVTDMNRENAFCVTLSPTVPAMDAPREVLEQEMERIAAHQSYAKTRYRVLKAKCALPFRQAIVDRVTAELGQQMETKTVQLQIEKGQEVKRQARARSISRNLKMTLSPTAARRPETVPALERLSELLNEEENT
jgi:hypothetical protein